MLSIHCLPAIFQNQLFDIHIRQSRQPNGYKKREKKNIYIVYKFSTKIDGVTLACVPF